MTATAPTYLGDVRCERVRGQSTLTTLRSAAPLKLLSPHSYGRCARVVASSFGGGLVTGDDVPVRIAVGAGAACVFTTQSSSKVYKSDGRSCRQSIEATVADDALLAVLPDPLVCFAGAAFRQRQTFDLAPSATLIWLDWLTAGRWASGERWAFGRYDSRTDVRVAGDLCFREALDLNSDVAPVAGPAVMGRFNCYAVLAALGPQAAGVTAAMKAAVDQWAAGDEPDLILSYAPIETGGILRAVGPSAESVQRQLRFALSPLTAELGEDPWGRKW